MNQSISTFRVVGFRVTLFLLILAVSMIIWDSIRSPKIFNSHLSYIDMVVEVGNYERNNYKDFLEIDGSCVENFWGTKYTLNLNVKNKAHVAIYSDLFVEVTFWSKTNSVIKVKEFPFYEVFRPGTTTDLSVDFDKIQYCDTVSWTLKSVK